MKVSVILPILNEAHCLHESLSDLGRFDGLEIIVVDGGSQDGSRDIALHYTPLVFGATPGRGRQMNVGARKATGDVFLFLHADTRIDPSGLIALRDVMSASGVVGGAFRLQVDSERFGVRCVVAGANLRGRWFGLPYGDQGIFVRASVFHRLGGYPEIPLMEDLSFVRRLHREGEFVLLSHPAITSSRRWDKEGVIFTTIRNWILVTLYFMGVSPWRLAKWYKVVR